MRHNISLSPAIKFKYKYLRFYPLRKILKIGHNIFDNMWKEAVLNYLKAKDMEKSRSIKLQIVCRKIRGHAYYWLANAMDMAQPHCHWRMFNKSMALAALNLLIHNSASLLEYLDEISKLYNNYFQTNSKSLRESKATRKTRYSFYLNKYKCGDYNG